MLAFGLRVEYIPWQAWLTLPLAIWVLYVLDRLSDRLFRARSSHLALRHRVHGRGVFIFLPLALAVGCGCLYIALFYLSRALLSAGVVVIFLCGLYFLFSILSRGRVPYTKNLLAGMLFALGVSVPVVASGIGMMSLDIKDVFYACQDNGWLAGILLFVQVIGMVFSASFFSCSEVWVFGLLCATNMMLVDFLEKDTHQQEPSGQGLLQVSLLFLAGGSLLFASLYGDRYSKPFYYAVMTSAALMLILLKNRLSFSPYALRAGVDLVLLAPLPLFFMD